MNEALIYMFVSLAAVAFCSFSMYCGMDSSAVRFTLGVILLSSLAIPVVSAVSSFSEFEFENIDFPSEEYSSFNSEKMLEDAFLKGIKYAVSEKFSISSENISVKCESFDSKTLNAKKIEITLSGKGAYADSRGIKAYIEEEKFGECEVILEFG